MHRNIEGVVAKAAPYVALAAFGAFMTNHILIIVTDFEETIAWSVMAVFALAAAVTHPFQMTRGAYTLSVLWFGSAAIAFLQLTWAL